jgi:hypothetical protein
MNKETLRMQMLAGVITESEYVAAINQETEDTQKDSLNEHMIGGIVGIGAINQTPSRAKADYENAFEHFLGERYELKPNRERDDIEDINEEDTVEGMEERAEEKMNEELSDSDNIDELIEMLELYISDLKELKITGPTEEQDFGSLINALEEEIRAFN